MTRSFYTGVLFMVLVLTAGCATSPRTQIDPLDQARTLIDAGKLEEGLAFLEKAMHTDPDRLALSNYYRFHVAKNKQFERSINFFKSEVEGKHSAVNEMYYNLGFAYIDKIPSVGPMGSGFLSKRAIKQFETVLERDPQNWIATYAIGMNYLHWPDYFKKNASAMDYLEKALALQKDEAAKPYHILTYIRLGDAYAKNGMPEKAYEIWREGLQYFPTHQDLLDRYNTPGEDISQAILQLYNPNNSIGEINTDISVLWESKVPESLVPLTKNPLRQAGVGGQLKGSEIQVGEGKIGLFSWFMRNLPFLSDKSRYNKVDMSSLGIKAEGGTHDLASLVAHGMIMGFLSQFEEETPEQARKRADDLSPFHRPFFHEGLGMGYAATASLDDVDELTSLIARLKKIDPHYTRLHLAGAGMWFGLESGNSEKVSDAFSRLGEFGEAYAYEGYGFSQTLFYFNNNPELIRRGVELGDRAAHSFYHGAGRALWILSGHDTQAFNQQVQETIPQDFHSDAYSGYGMGLAFTKVESPEFVFSFLTKPDNAIDPDQLLTGVTMGLSIRNLGDANYLRSILTSASPQDRCRIEGALQVGRQTLDAVSQNGGDLHEDWRNQIHHHLASHHLSSEWRACR